MTYTKLRLLPIPVARILALLIWGYSRAASRISPVPEQEALEIGVEAYIYGYPLVTMEMTRRIMSNVPAPLAMKAPMGQFANAREYPNAAFKDVTAPNTDTLYSAAWLDHSRALHPACAGRRWPVLPDAHAGRDGRTCSLVQGRARREPKLATLSSWAALEGCAAPWCCALQNPSRHGASGSGLTACRRRHTSNCSRR